MIFSRFALFLSIMSLLLFKNNVPVQSQEITIKKFTFSSSGSNKHATSNGKLFTLKQSIGQESITGTVSNNEITLIQGYIQPQLIPKSIYNSDDELNVEIRKLSYSNEYIIVIHDEPGSAEVAIYNTLGQKKHARNYGPYEEISVNLDPYPSVCYVISIQANQKYFSSILVRK